MKKIKVIVTFGTRPEAIKMIPVYRELQKNSNIFDVLLVVTGQHEEMLEQVLKLYNVIPDVNFNIMKSNQTLTDITNTLQIKYNQLLIEKRPDFVLVHGDTTTALIAAFEACYHKISVGHIEAGLRTYDQMNPFPEELNRQLISRMATFHFAPTLSAKNNLLKENVPGEIWITGNTGIDTLFFNLKKPYENKFLKNIVNSNKMILLTTHRRENLGKNMGNIFRAVKEIANIYPEYSIVYPVHMNPMIKEVAYKVLKDISNIHLIDPVDPISFHHYIDNAKIILTDSGGIQEEASSLGKPVLVLRETTERPEGIENGLKLIGTDFNIIINEVCKLLDDSDYYNSFSKLESFYGDGKAASRIVNILKENFYSEDE